MLNKVLFYYYYYLLYSLSYYFSRYNRSIINDRSIKPKQINKIFKKILMNIMKLVGLKCDVIMIKI